MVVTLMCLNPFLIRSQLRTIRKDNCVSICKVSLNPFLIRSQLRTKLSRLLENKGRRVSIPS